VNRNRIRILLSRKNSHQIFPYLATMRNIPIIHIMATRSMKLPLLKVCFPVRSLIFLSLSNKAFLFSVLFFFDIWSFPGLKGPGVAPGAFCEFLSTCRTCRDPSRSQCYRSWRGSCNSFYLQSKDTAGRHLPVEAWKLGISAPGDRFHGPLS